MGAISVSVGVCSADIGIISAKFGSGSTNFCAISTHFGHCWQICQYGALAACRSQIFTSQNLCRRVPVVILTGQHLRRCRPEARKCNPAAERESPTQFHHRIRAVDRAAPLDGDKIDLSSTPSLPQASTPNRPQIGARWSQTNRRSTPHQPQPRLSSTPHIGPLDGAS